MLYTIFINIKYCADNEYYIFFYFINLSELYIVFYTIIISYYNKIPIF